MKRLLILLVITAAGAVAACAPTENASPTLGGPDETGAPTSEPSAGTGESPAMSVEPSTTP
jgi:hypothetical protein